MKRKKGNNRDIYFYKFSQEAEKNYLILLMSSDK